MHFLFLSLGYLLRFPGAACAPFCGFSAVGTDDAELILSGCGSVGRAGGLGPSGRRFESCHSDQRQCRLLKLDVGAAAFFKTVKTVMDANTSVTPDPIRFGLGVFLPNRDWYGFFGALQRRDAILIQGVSRFKIFCFCNII